MRKTKKVFISVLVIAALLCLCSVPAFALTESDVQGQVDSVGREAVTGNIFIWFLCAIAFLKISQKIDSFMASLGINVGHTGGSMLAEAMIAARGISMAKGFSGKGGSGGGSGGSGSSGSSASFMGGGLTGVVSRNINKNAVKAATGNGGGGLSGRAFASSLNKGGGFANSVIGSVATGKISSIGSMTGETADTALSSYMGYTGMGEDAPSYSGVEIGGGHIFGTETSPENPEGISFGMYHTDQYTAPSGDHTTVTAADGTTWYKQYAEDAVKKTPYKAEDGSIAYRESIVKKMPDPPRRKDRI